MQTKNDDIVVQTATKTSEFKSIEADGAFIAFDPTVFSEVCPSHFSVGYWKEKDALTGFAKGRGTTWFLRHNQHQLVLRHYYRGGLIGKILHDEYFFNGLKNTRAYREFILLEKLQHLGLPAPAPIACKIEKKAFFYCINDIITARIEDTDSLVAILALHGIDEHLWQKIGHTIRRFHDHNVFHHDLNAHNILINRNNDVWLIDFDQGSIRNDTRTRDTESTWKNENLGRLKRSLIKEYRKNPVFHFHDADWKSLSEGYDT